MLLCVGKFLYLCGVKSAPMLLTSVVRAVDAGWHDILEGVY